MKKEKWLPDIATISLAYRGDNRVVWGRRTGSVEEGVKDTGMSG
jgi:hypothetical protein